MKITNIKLAKYQNKTISLHEVDLEVYWSDTMSKQLAKINFEYWLISFYMFSWHLGSLEIDDRKPFVQVEICLDKLFPIVVETET